MWLNHSFSDKFPVSLQPKLVFSDVRRPPLTIVHTSGSQSVLLDVTVRSTYVALHYVSNWMLFNIYINVDIIPFFHAIEVPLSVWSKLYL